MQGEMEGGGMAGRRREGKEDVDGGRGARGYLEEGPRAAILHGVAPLWGALGDALGPRHLGCFHFGSGPRWGRSMCDSILGVPHTRGAPILGVLCACGPRVCHLTVFGGVPYRCALFEGSP